MNTCGLDYIRYMKEVNNMQKGKKSEVNGQEINIGTKRTDASDKQKGVKKEKSN